MGDLFGEAALVAVAREYQRRTQWDEARPPGSEWVERDTGVSVGGAMRPSPRPAPTPQARSIRLDRSSPMVPKSMVYLRRVAPAFTSLPAVT